MNVSRKKKVGKLDFRFMLCFAWVEHTGACVYIQETAFVLVVHSYVRRAIITDDLFISENASKFIVIHWIECANRMFISSVGRMWKQSTKTQFSTEIRSVCLFSLVCSFIHTNLVFLSARTFSELEISLQGEINCRDLNVITCIYTYKICEIPLGRCVCMHTRARVCVILAPVHSHSSVRFV